MRTENSCKGSCPQRDSTEYKEYAEASSIYLPEDMEMGRELQADNLMEKVVTMENMEAAMKRVRQNNGAPGVDGLTVAETIEWMKVHFAEVQAEILEGRYRPEAVRRREIPKPGGGVRKLGIPTAKDRIVQQAIAQVLVPLYEPQFAENSFGYRPGRRGQQAIMKVKEYAEQGYEWAVVLDLSKYFDTLNHDRLVRELRKTVKDETMMKLIKKFLKAGVMENGVVIETTEGSPQGGNLSPLLSGIYLNEFDHVYARRGVPEIRYADDIVLLARSKRAAERLLEGSIKYLEGKLKLKVNRDKSRIVNLAFNYGEFKFLGFGMGKRNGTFHIYAHKKSKDRFRAKLKEITSRKRPGKMPVIFEELKRVINGWMNYFGIAEMSTWARDTDAWLRARIRMMLWKRWKKPKTKLKRLVQYGTPEKYAHMAAYSRRGYWFTVHTGAVTRALSNKMLAGIGYVSVSDTYKRVHEKPVQLQFAF